MGADEPFYVTAIRIWYRCDKCGCYGSFRQDEHQDIGWELRNMNRLHVESGICHLQAGDTMTDCPSCADLRADADHWRARYAAMLAAAKAGIAATAPDAPRDRVVPSVAGATPVNPPQDVQPDLRAAGGRTA